MTATHETSRYGGEVYRVRDGSFTWSFTWIPALRTWSIAKMFGPDDDPTFEWTEPACSWVVAGMAAPNPWRILPVPAPVLEALEKARVQS